MTEENKQEDIQEKSLYDKYIEDRGDFDLRQRRTKREIDGKIKEIKRQVSPSHYLFGNIFRLIKHRYKTNKEYNKKSNDKRSIFYGMKPLFKKKKNKKEEKIEGSAIKFAWNCLKENKKNKEFYKMLGLNIACGTINGLAGFCTGWSASLFDNKRVIGGGLAFIIPASAREFCNSKLMITTNKLMTKLSNIHYDKIFNNLTKTSSRAHLRKLNEKAKTHITNMCLAYSNICISSSRILMASAMAISSSYALISASPEVGIPSIVFAGLVGSCGVLIRNKFIKASQKAKKLLPFYMARRTDVVNQAETSRQFGIDVENLRKKDTTNETEISVGLNKGLAKTNNMLDFMISCGCGAATLAFCHFSGFWDNFDVQNALTLFGSSTAATYGVWNFVSHGFAIKDEYVNYMGQRKAIEETSRTMAGNEKIPYKHNTIELKDVCFAYNKDAQKRMKNTSVKFEPGKLQCIVGKSGNGKSTITDLMVHVYDVDSGKVLINGVDVKNTTEQEIEKHVLITDQFDHNFKTYSVCENMEMLIPTKERIAELKQSVDAGKIDEIEYLNAVDLYEHKDERIKEALEMAQAYELYYGIKGSDNEEENNKNIKNRRYGCECAMEEFSEGERQRLSLARSFLINKYRDICIFDECTSKLDPINAKKLVSSFRKLADEGKNVIVITHDPNLMAMADTVTVMENMNITAHGDVLEVCRDGNEYINNALKYENGATAEERVLASRIEFHEANGDNTDELRTEIVNIRLADVKLKQLQTALKTENIEQATNIARDFIENIRADNDKTGEKEAYRRLAKLIIKDDVVRKFIEKVYVEDNSSNKNEENIEYKDKKLKIEQYKEKVRISGIKEGFENGQINLYALINNGKTGTIA